MSQLRHDTTLCTCLHLGSCARATGRPSVFLSLSATCRLAHHTALPPPPSPTASDRSDEPRQFLIQPACSIAVGFVYQTVMAYANHFHAHENDDSTTEPSSDDVIPCVRSRQRIINPPPHWQQSRIQRLLEWRSKVRACELVAEAETKAEAEAKAEAQAAAREPGSGTRQVPSRKVAASRDSHQLTKYSKRSRPFHA